MEYNIAKVSKTLIKIYIKVLSKLKISSCSDPHFIAVLIGLLNTSFALTEPKSKVPNPVADFSNNPNTIKMNELTDNTFHLIALRYIEPDEEITLKYTLYNDGLLVYWSDNIENYSKQNK